MLDPKNYRVDTYTAGTGPEWTIRITCLKTGSVFRDTGVGDVDMKRSMKRLMKLLEDMQSSD